jgi:ribosomal protein S25
MHNGRMGRKIDPKTVNRAKDLFNKGLTPSVVAKRLGISESMARNIQREMPKKPVSSEESAV